MKRRLRAEDFFQDPSFPLYVHKTPVGNDVLPHGHDFVELVYVARGRALHRVETPDSEDKAGTSRARESANYEVMAGDVFVIAPSDIHEFIQPKDFAVYNVLFTPELLREDFSHLKKVEGLLELLVLEPFFRHETRFRHKLHLDLAARSEIEERLARIEQEIARAQAGFELVARAAFLEVLVTLGRAYSRQHSPSQADADLPGKRSAIQKALAFIEEKFADPLSLEAIAHQAYLSPNYFAELFKDRTGLSPWQYVTGIRIEQAKRLLVSTDKPITEIALDVGFSDSSHFAKVFKKQEGMTPRSFRTFGRNA